MMLINDHVSSERKKVQRFFSLKFLSFANGTPMDNSMPLKYKVKSEQMYGPQSILTDYQRIWRSTTLLALKYFLRSGSVHQK